MPQPPWHLTPNAPLDMDGQKITNLATGVAADDAATVAQAGGGGLPSWFQSGDGSPVGLVTPSQTGALFQDTADGALYVALGPTDADWRSVGGAGAGVPGVAANGSGDVEVRSADLGITRLGGLGTNNQIIINDSSAHIDFELDNGTYDFSMNGSGPHAGGFGLGFGNVILFDPSGVPDDAMGFNGCWCLSANGHIYYRTGGVWVDRGALTSQHSAPDDGDLSAGEAIPWFTQTNGAGAYNIKGKTANGTVVQATIPLASVNVLGFLSSAIAPDGAAVKYDATNRVLASAQQTALADLNLGTLTLLTEAITAIGTMQTKINSLLAKLRTAGVLAT